MIIKRKMSVPKDHPVASTQSYDYYKLYYFPFVIMEYIKFPNLCCFYKPFCPSTNGPVLFN